MKTLLFIFSLFLTSCSTASLQINSDNDFLTNLKLGKLSMKSSPMMELDEDTQTALFNRIKLISPEFQNFMFVFYYYKTDSLVYLVFYNWYTKHCELRIRSNDATFDGSQLVNELQPTDPIKNIDETYCFLARKSSR